MRREGRQHGLVITHIILEPPFNSKPQSRVVNLLDGPPTAGMQTKVSAKPTNHSKYTSRCGRPMCAICRLRPACKSKGKTKGNHKLKSSVMDFGDKLGFDGASATEVIGHFYGDNWTVESDGDAEYACNDDGLDLEKDAKPIEKSQLLVNDDEMGLDGDWILVEECEF